MTNLLIFSLGCLIAVTEANPYLSPPFSLQRAFRDCKTELSLSVPNTDKKLSLITPLNLTIFDHKYACLNKCILEKSGILSATGQLVPSALPMEMGSISTECNNKMNTSSLNTTTPACDREHNLAVCLIQKVNDKLNQTIMDCANETYTRLDRYKTYKLKDFLKEKKYYCMNRCVLIKMNKMDDGNGIKLDMVKFYAPQNANIPEIIKTCADDYTYSDQCKMVVTRELCIQKKLEKLGKDMLKD